MYGMNPATSTFFPKCSKISCRFWRTSNCGSIQRTMQIEKEAPTHLSVPNRRVVMLLCWLRLLVVLLKLYLLLREVQRHLDAFVDAHWQNMGEANSTQTSTSQAYEVEERKTDNIRLHGERTRDDGLNRVRCIGETVPRSNGDSLHILK